MADTPRTWAILEAFQVRLQTILTANDYRTNAGADVRLEPSVFEPEDAPRITLYSASTVHPGDARSPREREFTLIVEAQVSTEMEDAHAQVVGMAEDIEQSLETFLQLPDALPLEFQESLFLDRPDGMPAMCVQMMFVTRFRR